MRASWRAKEGDDGEDGCDNNALLLRHLDRERLDRIDPFDRVQLEDVIRVCRASRTLSEAGRRLFSASRQRKGKVNDADRLRKYLARFGLEWGSLGP